MMEQIDRDVMRTHPDMHFFSGDGEPSKRHREVCMSITHVSVHLLACKVSTKTTAYHVSAEFQSRLLRHHNSGSLYACRR